MLNPSQLRSDNPAPGSVTDAWCSCVVAGSGTTQFCGVLIPDSAHCGQLGTVRGGMRRGSIHPPQEEEQQEPSDQEVASGLCSEGGQPPPICSHLKSLFLARFQEDSFIVCRCGANLQNGLILRYFREGTLVSSAAN